MKRLFLVYGRFNVWYLILMLVLSLGTGGLSGVLIMDAMKTYQDLQQPAWAPPSAVFAPVWTVLYILIGIAGYRILMYGQKKQKVKGALILYSLQLIFNFSWPLIFFRLGLRGAALVDIVILLLLIILTTRTFFRFDKLAGYLFLPYLLWVAYASVLNCAVWILNR